MRTGFAARALLAVAVSMLAAALVASGVPAAGSAHDHGQVSGVLSFRARPMAVQGATQAQLTATASQGFYRFQTFWQNNTGIYGGSSTKATFPVNFSAYADYTSVQGASQAFTPSAYQGYIPQLNVTQGGKVLANGTAPLPFTLAINATSGQSVVDRAVELYTTQNALPASGRTYGIATNATQTIQYTYLSNVSWTYNESAYLTNYSITSPASYGLSNVQLFLPFPSGVTPDYTTSTLQYNGVSQTAFQVVPSGFSFDPPDIAAGKTAYVAAQFQPEPNLGGAAPTVVLRSYAAFNSSYELANGTWTNLGNLAYYGEYVLTANFPYAMLAPTMNLYADGGLLPRTSYAVSGDVVTILPEVLKTPVGGTAFFDVYFQFAGAPPSLSLTKTGVAFAYGDFVITTASGLAVLAMLVLLVTVVAWLVSPRARRDGRTAWVAIALELAIAAAYVLAAPVGF